jgi:hypothetical protein
MMENSRSRSGSLMKAGFPTICGQRVKGDSMPIAASATCYYPTPCARGLRCAGRRSAASGKGLGENFLVAQKNCQPPLQPIVAKGEKRPQQSYPLT